MSFFYNATKAEGKTKPKVKPARGVIPIASLRQLGCSVCPKDKDETLRSPKLEPSGPETASVYLLGAGPSERDDEQNNHWCDKAGDAIYKAFGRAFMESEVRSNYIVQCAGELGAVEVECCRERIVADIERVKPVVIVGVGDEPLRWATAVKSGGSIPHRGTLFTVKVGSHVCYYYCLLYPNYVHKKGSRKSEYELALLHDVREVKALVNDQWFARNPPTFYSKPYDAGVEIITGHQPGDMQRLEAALKRLAAHDHSALDIETSGLRPFMQVDPALYTAAVGVFEDVVAFPLDHPDGWGSSAQRGRAWDLFINYLLTSGRKAAHNLAMEQEWLLYFLGPKVLRQTEWDDTMAMAHTIDERPGTKSLGMQTTIYFGFDLKAQSNIDASRLLEYPIKDVLRYNGMDTKWTDALRRLLRPRIAAVDDLNAEYERKVRLAPTLVLTETKGLPVDFAYAGEMRKKLVSQIDDVEDRLQRCPEVKEYRQRYGPFSATNDDHVLRLMRDVLQRPEVRVEDARTGATSFTTGEEVLSKIPNAEVPSARMVLEHRGSSKLLSTYIEPLVSRKIVCPDGVIRCKYSSMVAVTGRLASEDPNFQNWPKRKNREIRGALYAPDGQVILACDYGQIEFRVVGMASEDKNLVKYCWTGYDVHKYWAERMVAEYGPIKDYIVETFGVDWDEKGLKTLRQEAKNGWVFPQLFGSSTRSCAEQLHLPDDIAEDLGAEFWDEFAGVKRWQEKLLQGYERNLYVETLGGRKRRGPMTKNQIINMPIQGTAADIVTEAMCALSERAEAEDNSDLQPNLNVHDDLTFLLPEGNLKPALKVIVEEMCLPRFDYINVPLVVEASVGWRWHELTELHVYKSHELFGHPNPYLKG